jgi:hypothetical protein
MDQAPLAAAFQDDGEKDVAGNVSTICIEKSF